MLPSHEETQRAINFSPHSHTFVFAMQNRWYALAGSATGRPGCIGSAVLPRHCPKQSTPPNRAPRTPFIFQYP
jgi:hypothetical protein